MPGLFFETMERLNQGARVKEEDFDRSILLTQCKVDYDRLNRAVAALENGIFINVLFSAILGGWAGPPEGAAIISVTESLLSVVALSGTNVTYHPIHMKFKNGATSGRETLWMESVLGQAMSRNTDFPVFMDVFNDARAGTVESLYQAAGNAVVAVSCGGHVGPGPSGTVGGEDVDCVSPLEARMMGETSRAAVGLSLKQANEIANYCLSKYEQTLGNPPKGPRFQEMYDIDTLKPKEEYIMMFESVKEDLKAHGLAFRY